jgi:methionine aminopeptidase
MCRDVALRHGVRTLREFCGHGIGRDFHAPPQIAAYRALRVSRVRVVFSWFDVSCTQRLSIVHGLLPEWCSRLVCRF